MDIAQLKQPDMHYRKKKKKKSGAQRNNKYPTERQDIGKHPHIPVFSESLFIELLFQFGTQSENANTIWWDNRKNAGVLLALWGEKKK